MNITLISTNGQMTMKTRKGGGNSRLSKSNKGRSDNERDIVVLFADVVGCSEISNHSSLEEYGAFITSFQDCFKRVCQYYGVTVYEPHEHHLFQYEPRGDEGCLKILASRNDEDLARDVDVAISIALDLKKMWLFTERNRKRIIEGKLLPVELAIGIHMGKVYLKDSTNGRAQPEGYAINLAKRVEGASRTGRFTHIFVSEAAHGQLYYLKDETVYKFTEAFPIPAKGLSQAIRVFEIKHHYLPTDWMDVVEEEPWEISMVYPELGGGDILTIAESAYEINPTNLWLAEEYLMLTMMDAYRKGKEANKDNDPKYLEKMGYGRALEVAQRITNSDLRDGTLLSEWGQILGDLGRFDEEEEKYREAMRLEESDPDFHWYLGLCLSYQISEDVKKEKTSLKEYYEQDKKNNWIQEVLKEYKLARDLAPMNPWIAYSYACELSWWSQVEKDMKERAIDMLVCALTQKTYIGEWAVEEEYLKPIINDSRIEKCLGNQ